MSNNNTPLRVGVFYDGNFLLHASNFYNYIHPQRSRLSINGLHNFFRHRAASEEGIDPARAHIVEAHYFRGRINAAEAAQRGNQLYNDRVFEDILMAEGVHTHYLPLRNFGGRKEERGIDVWLSLEAYEMALNGKIDVAVLVLSDTDFVPLQRKLSSLGVRVLLISWEFDYLNDDGGKVVTKTSHELLQLATYPVPMYEVIEEGIEKNDPLVMRMFVNSENQSPPSGEREVGEILSIKNGFGFVKYPNNNLFFHSQDVVGDFAELAPGDMVEFSIGRNQQRQDVAKEVVKLDPDQIGNYAHQQEEFDDEYYSEEVDE